MKLLCLALITTFSISPVVLAKSNTLQLESQLKNARQGIEDSYDSILKIKQTAYYKVDDLYKQTEKNLTSIFSKAERLHISELKKDHSLELIRESRPTPNLWRINWNTMKKGTPLAHRSSQEIDNFQESVQQYSSLVKSVKSNFDRLDRTYGQGPLATNVFRKEVDNLEGKASFFKNIKYSFDVLRHYKGVRSSFAKDKGIRVVFKKDMTKGQYQLDHQLLSKHYDTPDIELMALDKKKVLFENLLEFWGKLRTPVDSEGNLADLKGFVLEVADSDEISFVEALALKLDQEVNQN